MWKSSDRGEWADDSEEAPESDNAGRPRGELLRVRGDASDGGEWIRGDREGVGGRGAAGDVADLSLRVLLRDSSGSFRKTHSRPRLVHLAQGHSRLHLILDSAHACEGRVKHVMCALSHIKTYLTGFSSRAIHASES